MGKFMLNSNEYFGGESSTLAGLSDVSASNPSDGQKLKYNATSGKWEKYTAGFTLLWDYSNFTPTSGTSTVTRNLTMSQSIENFDAVLVMCMLYNSQANDYWEAVMPVLVPKQDYYKSGKITSDGYMYQANGSFSSNQRRLNFSFTSSTNLMTVARRAQSNEEPFAWKVYGIKL